MPTGRLGEATATIWRTPVMAALLRLPGVHLRVIYQGLFASSSPKPMGLVAVNVQTLDQRLRQWQLTSTAPTDKSFGLAADGSFLSAPLKEYPPAMCGAVAAAFVDEFCAEGNVSGPDPPEDFRVRCKALVSEPMGTKIGLDFAGG